jgi:ParB family chromosome partitioning protein
MSNGEVRLVEVASVRTEGRHRRDYGDIGALAQSIDDLGLLQPIAITPDGRLIAGERRLRAIQRLGHDVIEAHIVNGLDDAVVVLRAERDENTCRKDFTPTEEHDLYAALLELERPKAKERQVSGQAKPGEGKTGAGKFPGPTAESRQLAAAGATGKPGRHKTLEKVGEVKAAASNHSLPAPVQEVAKRALEEIDGTGKVDGAYQKVKAAERAAAAPKPDPGVSAVLDNDQTAQDATYVHNFMAAFNRENAWLGFDAERVGRLIDETEVRLLTDRAASAERFVKAVKRARMGLRLINGGTG